MTTEPVYSAIAAICPSTVVRGRPSFAPPVMNSSPVVDFNSFGRTTVTQWTHFVRSTFLSSPQLCDVISRMKPVLFFPSTLCASFHWYAGSGLATYSSRGVFFGALISATAAAVNRKILRITQSE